MTKVSSQTVHIVGGGVSGLSCARHLQRHAIDCRILEASDGVGGRIRTDDVDGFRLDRGFQVFQTAYPEARAVLDYGKLDLVPLVAGALVRNNSKWIPQVDPFRHPSYALRTVFNRLGTLSDRLKLVRLLWDVWRTPLAALTASSDDKSTSELLLTDYGVSEEYVDRFLRPWLSGIFLESELATSARFFKFVLKMLSAGKICYPRAGIQAIPDQLAAALPDGSIELNCPVHRRDDGLFEYADGRTLNEKVVLAVPMHQAALMANKHDVDRGSVSTTCVYFAANRPPVEKPILMLNGDGDGPANHVFVMTNASPHLAPTGKALISVSLVGEQAMTAMSC